MQHLACIMDGNRRWAKQHNKPSCMGHQAGAEIIETVVQFCLQRTISYLSLYTFSLENHNRSEAEKAYLFDLIAQMASPERIEKLMKDNIRIRFIGKRDAFPSSILPAITDIEEQTKQNTALSVQLLFYYGARQELIDATKQIAQQIVEKKIAQQDITEELFSRYLWTVGIPEPDLIVRTGGALRLSNFLLYQAAYSELYFLNCFWPEVTQAHLQQAFDYFQQCKRNFGS